ncbi:zinc-ribbon and DUF3426 domain-containing protein [Pararobbsia alpina]|uniref:zinc-ribbon and DUF3426 domain-containing protein n=1 Tax=Pararobbsia alpina TaxID=621374 RepID=UPI0039A4187A
MFRIVPDQLKLHRGLVRCGHCREVFDGVLHQVEPPPAKAAPPAPAAPSTPVESSSPAAAPTGQHDVHEEATHESGVAHAEPTIGETAAAAAAAAAAALAAKHAAHTESTPVEHEERHAIEASHADIDEQAVEQAPHDTPEFEGRDLSHPHDAVPAEHDAATDEARHSIEASHLSADEEQITGSHDEGVTQGLHGSPEHDAPAHEEASHESHHAGEHEAADGADDAVAAHHPAGEAEHHETVEAAEGAHHEAAEAAEQAAGEAAEHEGHPDVAHDAAEAAEFAQAALPEEPASFEHEAHDEHAGQHAPASHDEAHADAAAHAEAPAPAVPPEFVEHPEHFADSLGRTEPRLAPDFDTDADAFEAGRGDAEGRKPAPATPPEWDETFGELPPGAPSGPFAPRVDFSHEAPEPEHIATPLGATPPTPVIDSPDFGEVPVPGTHIDDLAREEAAAHAPVDEHGDATTHTASDEAEAHTSSDHDAFAEHATHGVAQDHDGATHEGVHAQDTFHADAQSEPLEHHEDTAAHESHASHDVHEGHEAHEAHDFGDAGAFAGAEAAQSAFSGAHDDHEAAEQAQLHDTNGVEPRTGELDDLQHGTVPHYGHDDEVIDVEPTSSTPNYGANHHTDPWAPPADTRMEPALSFAAATAAAGAGAAAAAEAATASPAFAPLAEDSGNDFRIRVEPHDTHAHELHPARRALGWIVALLLLVLLVAQLAWWQREPIMSRWPNSVATYHSVCAKLGCLVTPPRAIDQLQIESSTLTQSTVPNQFQLAMSLHNRAALALAWPSLEISLLDQNNQLVIRRVVAPGQYLPAGADLNGGLAADGHQAVNLQLTATGTAPANYKVLIFYP